MKSLAPIVALLIAATHASAQQLPWQKLSDPTAAEVTAAFASPPSEYSSQFDWGFSDKLSREDMAHVLDRAKSLGILGAYVEPKPGNSPYLSPGYFAAVKTVVEEARKRDMHIWFDDDGGYPSGFAGGKFTNDRPDLRSQGLVAPQRVAVTAGQDYTYKVEPATICVLAVNHDTGATQVLDSSSGTVNWKVPAGNWEILLPRSAYRSGPTRSANNPTGAKDATHSLMDYLNPEADKAFADWTFEAYKAVVGDEFGKTVLGFRGDEPGFGFNPWSPVLLAEFQKRKGYDLRPYLGVIATQGGGGRGAGRGATQPAGTGRGQEAEGINTDEAHRVYADYCDVWSDLFGQNFFGSEAQWCADNRMELQMHIVNEEALPRLAGQDGDFFKCMRSVQVPGVDAIWHQVWHDVVADYPKLASSAAHLNGRPRAMTEVFAAYNPQPDFKEAGWILNHLLVLGINRIEYMGMGTTGPAPRGFYADPGFPALSAHINRACYVLGEGRPAAQIGVYIPSSSFWFRDNAADTKFRGLVHQLLEHQRDLDFVDDYSLAHAMKQQGGELVNPGGQAYRAILIPPVTAISKAALDRLHAFAQAGGKVLFFEKAPALVMDKNFLTATGPANISWTTLEPSSEITDRILATLPEDLSLNPATPAPGLKYLHRRLKDADLYFFFNEGDQPLSLQATLTHLAPARSAQLLDTSTGKVSPWEGASPGQGKTTLPLDLPAWSTKMVLIQQ